jgi:hypothetical protein
MLSRDSGWTLLTFSTPIYRENLITGCAQINPTVRLRGRRKLCVGHCTGRGGVTWEKKLGWLQNLAA